MSHGGAIGWHRGPARARRTTLALPVALLVAGHTAISPGPALADYQGSVYSNVTAFSSACIGFDDPYPAKLRKAAQAAISSLGFASTSHSGDDFTRKAFLGRTPTDWAVYVHSHGDYYGGKPGFRPDNAVCSANPVTSADIALKRPSTQLTNLVFFSTCHLGEGRDRNDMPLVYGIEKVKAGTDGWQGNEFYLGYIGLTWDSDHWTFETIFWDRLLGGASLGKAFDIAMATGTFRSDFDANWWGSYTYHGVPGPYSRICDCYF